MFKIIKRKLIPVAALMLVVLQANAASLSVTFVQDSASNNAVGTLLTLTFANDTNNAMTFSDSDFISREWTNLTNLGMFNLSDTSVSANINITPDYQLSSFNFVETDNNLESDTFSYTNITSTRIFDAINENIFYLDSVTYDALSTPTSVVSTVPVPAAAWLFGSAILGLFGFSQRRKRVNAHPV